MPPPPLFMWLTLTHPSRFSLETYSRCWWYLSIYPLWLGVPVPSVCEHRLLTAPRCPLLLFLASSPPPSHNTSSSSSHSVAACTYWLVDMARRHKSLALLAQGETNFVVQLLCQPKLTYWLTSWLTPHTWVSQTNISRAWSRPGLPRRITN